MQLSKFSQHHVVKRDQALCTLNIQNDGGTPAAITTGVQFNNEPAKQANQSKREATPASHVTIALKFGASDAHSAISANPALGIAVDTLLELGGSAILSETFEIHGAEHILIARAASDSLDSEPSRLIHCWGNYAERHDGTLNSNPSPDNPVGGMAPFWRIFWAPKPKVVAHS